MSKLDFECQNTILGPILNVKIGFRPYMECQNRILNVKIRYSTRFRMSKQDFECQNTIFGLSLNVKIKF